MKTIRYDYSFLFQSIQNWSTKVTLISYPRSNPEHFTIAIDDQALSISGLSSLPSISADLLDLALAIHAVDRLIKRNQDIPLSFYVKLPIRNFDILSKSEVYNLLTSTLGWYTNDHWHFEFSKREVSYRHVEVQPQLPLNPLPSKNEVALWSGGLDSLSGLYTRLIANPETYYVLVGTGSNSQVIKRQRLIADEINRLFPKRTSLIQIPYRWRKTPSIRKNFAQRSRGLVFMLIGIACAHHIGQNSLYLYENGVGAINLSYTKGEVGLDQAKSVHPLSLLQVSQLVSAVIDTPFHVTNPFWLWTKGQMVESLNSTDGKYLITLSSSCDRTHRLKEGIIQCGVCTSCLLRRQSLSALGIEDETIYDKRVISKSGRHLQAMQHQANTIRALLKQDDQWLSLSSEYYDLDDIVDQMSLQTQQPISILRRQIIQLYSSYVDEWKVFEEHIEKTLQVV
jgi:7-cyano-7-deazaguanine synthase in queuosine biosynthesis